MQKKTFKLKLAVLFFSILTSINAIAANVEIGKPFPVLVATDQHEKIFHLTDKVQYILVSFDMSTGKKTNRYLEAKGQAFLDGHQAVFMANIDGMPWIGRQFALPKMRRYPHQIILLDQPGLLDDFPKKPNCVSVFKLDEKHIVEAVEFWNPEAAELILKP
jgi:hypothetical protein